MAKRFEKTLESEVGYLWLPNPGLDVQLGGHRVARRWASLLVWSARCPLFKPCWSAKGATGCTVYHPQRFQMMQLGDINQFIPVFLVTLMILLSGHSDHFTNLR